MSGNVGLSSAPTTGKTQKNPIPIIIAVSAVFIVILNTQASLHFRMTCPQRRLLLAISLSLLVHLLPFLPYGKWLQTSAKPPPPPPLQVRLKPPAPALAVPPLILPDPAHTASPPPQPPQPPPPPAKIPGKTSNNWQSAVKKQLRQLYSAEAIALRLEGDPVVLFILDPEGNVSAARIEQSSGYPILDRDALNAVRSLRALPDTAPREVVLPLRFRLKD